MSIICKNWQDLYYLDEEFRRHRGEMILGIYNLESYFNCVFPSLGNQNYYTAQDQALFNFMTIIFSKERKFSILFFGLAGVNFCIFLIYFWDFLLMVL